MTVTAVALQPVVVDEDIHCPACSSIRPKQHRFAELLASTSDRETSYYAAGYIGEDWSQLVLQLLSHSDVLLSYNFHCKVFSRKAVDWGQELRERERKQSRGNVYDLWEAQPVDSESWRHLETIIKDGVEVEDKDGETSFRPPTAAELRRAVYACCEIRMKAPQELTYDEQMQAEAITVDGRGKLQVQTARGAARARSAKLEGLEATTKVEVAVTVSMEAWTLKFAAAVAAEALTLSQLVEELRGLLSSCAEGPRQLVALGQAVDDLAEAVPQLEVRVLGRVG